KALMKMVDQVVEKTVHPETRVLGITYVNCRERAIMVRDAILARINVKEVILQEAGGLSSTYANDGGIIVVI
ncbi:MAG: DegV family protein, partial [Lachnospiraceae bacterium]|nr:DegV family protein [Lachnospiraceae bacterium]